MTSQFSDMTSTSNFFDVVLFLLSSLVTGPSFMSMSSLVLELWQFSFIRDWPEIRKSEIPLSEFLPISGDWGELGMPNLARMSLIKCYWMLQNARVTAFTISELLRENQKGGKFIIVIVVSKVVFFLCQVKKLFQMIIHLFLLGLQVRSALEQQVLDFTLRGSWKSPFVDA